MFGFFKSLFGKPVDYKQLLLQGAQIIDVRTPAEFSGGNIKGSKNIPLQNLMANINKLDKSKPVITCCASGMRSASAKQLLKGQGFEAYNGGGWTGLKNKLG